MVQADGGYGDITAFRVGLGGARAGVRGPGQGRDLGPAGRRSPGHPRLPTVADARPRLAIPTSPSASRSWCSPPDASRSARSGGAKATAARSPASSSRSGFARPTTPNATRMACCPSGGCWPSGPRARTSRSSTGSPTCPPTRHSTRSCALAKLRWRVEHDYRELKQCLGLDHYEGRTYTGLHHHLTCVTVAHAFLTCCRLARGDPDAARPQPAAA